jgi:hypothetical protein
MRSGATLGEAVAQLLVAIAEEQEAQTADHFSFDLGAAGPEMQGAPGGALSVPVTVRVSGVEFTRFHVDP